MSPALKGRFFTASATWEAQRRPQWVKEINPGISLEGMMVKLKLQYFGHYMRRVDSLEKTLMLGGMGLIHSVVFLYLFVLFTAEGFLISPCYSLELCIQMGISFLFSFVFCFCSFHSYL